MPPPPERPGSLGRREHRQQNRNWLPESSVLSRQTLGGTAGEFEEPSSSRLSSPKTGPPPLFSLLHLQEKKNYFSSLNFFLILDGVPLWNLASPELMICLSLPNAGIIALCHHAKHSFLSDD